MKNNEAQSCDERVSLRVILGPGTLTAACTYHNCSNHLPGGPVPQPHAPIVTAGSQNGSVGSVPAAPSPLARMEFGRVYVSGVTEDRRADRTERTAVAVELPNLQRVEASGFFVGIGIHLLL